MGRTFDSCRQYLDSTSAAELAMAGLYADWRGKQLSLSHSGSEKALFRRIGSEPQVGPLMDRAEICRNRQPRENGAASRQWNS